MMELLKQFAALSLISGLLLTLLPDGSMRRTAVMAVGLLLLLCWSEGLSAVLGPDLLPIFSAPATALTNTGLHIDDASEKAAGAMQALWEGAP